ncbi:hypothetical protein M9H77_11483 [Catharanthus roseus]|uniref:Uncharacterized protein n=1 Tax=Catharanthus roseus TaxID=4058 RepID=A0ACC0BEN0_CATRO|nr:hypothetical protein M9H77_11483 [Catharanthus roseus]
MDSKRKDVVEDLRSHTTKFSNMHNPGLNEKASVSLSKKVKREHVHKRIEDEDSDFLKCLNTEYMSILGNPKPGFSIDCGDDPSYALFLSSLKNDGSSYVLQANEKTGLTKPLKYMENDPNGEDENDLDSHAKTEGIEFQTFSKVIPTFGGAIEKLLLATGWQGMFSTMCYVFPRKMHRSGAPYRASSDDMYGFFTLRVETLEEGRSTLRAWPNRTWFRWPCFGDLDFVRGAPLLHYMFFYIWGVEAALMCLDSLRLPSCARNPHVVPRGTQMPNSATVDLVVGLGASQYQYKNGASVVYDSLIFLNSQTDDNVVSKKKKYTDAIQHETTSKGVNYPFLLF